MDSLEFLTKILPQRGHYVLAVLSRGTKKEPLHEVVDTVKELDILWQKYDSIPNREVYHACATYKERFVWRTVKGKRKKRTRLGSNTAYIRCQWIDIDVDPEDPDKYPTRKAALEDLKRVCKLLHIPMPMIVLSGAGLHCYWVFSEDVSAQTHVVIADGFKKQLKEAGLKADPARTADMASVLRPIGSHHKKTDKLLPVKLLHDQAKPIPYTWWQNKFKEDVPGDLLGLAVGQPVEIPGVDPDEDWTSGLDLTPAGTYSIVPIAKSCAVIADFVKTGGEGWKRDRWRAAIGICKHTEEGEKAAHKFSSKADEYSEDETQDIYDGWETPPATCRSLEAGDSCANCPHKGKLASPIKLGWKPDRQIIQPLQFASPEDFAKVVPDLDNRHTLPFYPHAKYKWENDWLFVFDVPSDSKGDKGAEKQWIPISRTLYYPYMRFRNDDGTYGLKMCVQNPNGNWRLFEIDTKYVGASNAEFGKVMAVNEVTVLGKENANKHYINDVLRGLQQYEVIAPNYDCFGWHHNSVDEDNEGLGDGFVIGATRLTGTKSVPVMISKAVPSKLVAGLKPRGSAAGWVDGVDTVYNVPGAEPYQFIIGCAISAPLVALVGIDTWRGIMALLTGASGLGKTTTCKVACSFYGSPDALTVSANKGGATLVGLLGRIAMHQHLPITFDELTGADTATAQQLMYSVAHGEPKIRGNVDGSERINNKRWATISFGTSNESMTALLNRNSDQSAAEATQVRCFEIALPDDFNTKVFAGIDAKDIIETQLLAEHWGAPGVEFLQHIIRNRDAITTKLRKDRIKLADQLKYKTSSKERFYIDLISLVRVAMTEAKKLGLITFDVDNVVEWAIDHIATMRAARTATLMTPEDYLQAFFSDTHHGIIRTKRFGDGRSKAEYVDETALRSPIGRIATDDKVFLITKTAFSRWCKENSADEAKLLVDWEGAGYLQRQPKDDRERITKGTNLPGTQVRCLHFKYDVVMANKPPHLMGVPATQTKT